MIKLLLMDSIELKLDISIFEIMLSRSSFQILAGILGIIICQENIRNCLTHVNLGMLLLKTILCYAAISLTFYTLSYLPLGLFHSL